MDEISIPRLALEIPTEADAYIFLERLRWGTDLAGQRCPHCDSDRRFYFLNPENGSSRKTRTGANSQRRVWKCADCRRQFSVTTNTVMHGSKVPIRTWVFIWFELCASKNGVSAREIERKYDLTAKTAWFVCQRVREAMRKDPLAGMMRGVVVADEAFIGGAAKNMHRNNPRRADQKKGGAGKPAILSLISEETGQVHTQVVRDVTGATLQKAIAQVADVPNTILHTDEGRGYMTISPELAGHETVTHSKGQYVNKAGAGTNRAENFFSQLKRSIDGTHHAVSRRHLPRYLAEYDYRYNTKDLSDTARMRKLIGQMGDKRLTYRPLTER